MPLVRLPAPFDDPAWIFELKYDGFRAVAFIDAGECRLVSRNGHTFRQFGSLTAAFPACHAMACTTGRASVSTVQIAIESLAFSQARAGRGRIARRVWPPERRCIVAHTGGL